MTGGADYKEVEGKVEDWDKEMLAEKLDDQRAAETLNLLEKLELRRMDFFESRSTSV